ncbi:DNA helicase, TBP-interacting protein [Pseudoloma neurophilia]|uniref:DNA helicase, TBP-interacting protein n=1 Tax=Pseudoloma neurophilia TaxID=146866 RepID=A0A0R0LVV8_9MICR|nr:DNA helicase, TBP-interacting protein [Pseudoloma neurophilia]
MSTINKLEIFQKHLCHLKKTSIALPFLILTDDQQQTIKILSDNNQLNIKTVTAYELTDSNLYKFVRMAISCNLSDLKIFYEGEITNINVNQRIFTFTLRTSKGSQTVTLNKNMYETVSKENLAIGDVIYLEPKNKIIRKLKTHSTFLEGDQDIRKIDLKDEVEKINFITQKMTLFEIDSAYKKRILQSRMFESRKTYNNNITLCDNFCSDMKYNEKRDKVIMDQSALSESVIDLKAMSSTDLLLEKYADNNLLSLETNILLIKDLENLEIRLIQKILNFLENEKFVPIVLLMTENKEFVQNNKKYFKNINSVKLSPENKKNTAEEIEKYLQKLESEKGKEFVNLIRPLAQKMTKDELMEVTKELVP